MRFLFCLGLVLCVFYLIDKFIIGKSYEVIEDVCNIKMLTGFCFMYMKNKKHDCVRLYYTEEECDKLWKTPPFDKQCWAFYDKKIDDCNLYLDYKDVISLMNVNEPYTLYVMFLIYLMLSLMIIVKFYRYNFTDMKVKDKKLK